MATLLHAFALAGFLFFGAIARLGPFIFSDSDWLAPVWFMNIFWRSRHGRSNQQGLSRSTPL